MVSTASFPLAPRRKLRWFRRVTLRLIIIALVPVLGLSTFASAETFGRRDAANVAEAVGRQTSELADIVELRFLISQEQIPTLALSLAPTFGLSAADVEQMLGLDLTAKLTKAREELDAVLERRPDDDSFAAAKTEMTELRAGFSSGAIDGMTIFNRMSTMLGQIDERIGSEALETFQSLPDRKGVADVRSSVEQLLLVHRAITVAGSQFPAFFAAAIPGFSADVSNPLSELTSLTAVYNDSISRLDDELTGEALFTWKRVESNEAQIGFATAIADTIAGTAPSFLSDLNGAGQIVRDGLDRHRLHYELLDAARVDLERSTITLRTTSLNSFANALLWLFAVGVMSVLVVYYTGRSITRPLQRLARRAAAVSAGDIHTERGAGHSGPFEVQTVSSAFEDVVGNLKAIDAQALALAASHFDDPVLAEPLPGRLGQSLQASVVLLSQSISEREELHRRLAHEATHDGLTGFPNRSAAMFALEGAIARNKRRGTSLAVLFIDLDDFKRTNDTLGHGVGDAVLRETSRRLLDMARTDDTVARLGGDEFLLVAESIGSIHDAVAIAERVIETVSAPIRLDGRVLRIGASVGVSMTLDGYASGDQLVREADLAVYRAKQAGRGRVEVFDDAMRAEVGQRSEIEVRLAEALKHSGLTVAYQPVVDCATLTIRGFEALVRWRGPDGRPIPPDAFIPIAEASDLIVDLDRWVITTATAEIAEWSRRGLGGDLHLAVNVSGRHLVDRRIVGHIAEALRSSGLEPHRLVLEITETVLLSDMPVACGHLEQIRGLGVTIALDDFGSGYTSLATLRQLPVDVLKIDRSLVEELQPDKGQSLVRLIIEAAHEFGMGVIAEGVETEEQRALLQGLGCEQVQGWLVSPAVPAAEAQELVTSLAR